MPRYSCLTSWNTTSFGFLTDIKKNVNDYDMISILYGIWKEMIQINLFTKQKQIHRLREPTYGSSPQQRGQSGVIDWEFGIDMYTLLYLK